MHSHHPWPVRGWKNYPRWLGFEPPVDPFQKCWKVHFEWSPNLQSDRAHRYAWHWDHPDRWEKRYPPSGWPLCWDIRSCCWDRDLWAGGLAAESKVHRSTSDQIFLHPQLCPRCLPPAPVRPPACSKIHPHPDHRSAQGSGCQTDTFRTSPSPHRNHYPDHSAGSGQLRW